MWTVPTSTQTAAELVESALTLTVLVHAGVAYMHLWVIHAELTRRHIRSAFITSGILAIVLSGVLVIVTGLRLAAAPLTDVVHPSIWGTALWWEPVAVCVAIVASVPLTVFAWALIAKTKSRARSSSVAPSSTALRIAATAPATVTAAAPSLMGHSQTTQPVWLATLVDAAHLALGAFWLGGVLCLVLLFVRPGTRHERQRQRVENQARADSPEQCEAELLLNTVSRFSHAALITVIALVATGAGSAVLIFDTPSALVESDYGRILLVKVTLVMCAGAVAVWNRAVLLPDLRRRSADTEPDRPSTITLLARSLMTEALILLSVAAVTGVLTHHDPHMHPMG